MWSKLLTCILPNLTLTANANRQACETLADYGVLKRGHVNNFYMMDIEIEMKQDALVII